MNIQSERGIQFSGGMPQFRPSNRVPLGDAKLRTSDPRHMQIGPQGPETQRSSPAGGFAEMLSRAISDVENVDAKSRDLTTRSIYDPDSVEVHDVMIAAEKSRFALNLTKSVADGLVRTFRELTTPR